MNHPSSSSTLGRKVFLLMAGIGLCAVFLAGCGGASDSAGDGKVLLQAAAVLATSNLLDVDASSATATTTTTTTEAKARAQAVTLTTEQFFDWAETQYPALFTSHQTTQTLDIYQYRFYNGLYLAVRSATEVVALGPVTNNQIVSLGELQSYRCKVVPSDCTTAVSEGSTAGVQCNYVYSALNTSASVNKISTSAWSCNSTSRTLSANGIPDHAVGTFPNRDNPNTITAQTVSANFTLTPTLTTTATTLGGPRGTIAFALNGIKFDAGTNGACDNSGSTCSLGALVGPWNIEALGQSNFKFGTDSNNAHVQPDGVYHYHGMPEGVITKQNKGPAMTLIGWAADGFPIYARYGYSVATNSASAIKVIASSYRLKAIPDANRPATTLYPMGAFTQDYEYVAGSGDLDQCNGRTGVTPEFPKGTYQYFATDTYPFLQRCVKGAVTATAPPGQPPLEPPTTPPAPPAAAPSGT